MTLYIAVYVTRDDNRNQIRAAIPWSLYQEDMPELLYTETQARTLAGQIAPGTDYDFQDLEVLENWWPGCDVRLTCDYMQLGWDAGTKQPLWQPACDESAVAFHDNPTDGENNMPLYACMWHAPYMADSLAACQRREPIQEP
jgi:hypothetical protein